MDQTLLAYAVEDVRATRPIPRRRNSATADARFVAAMGHRVRCRKGPVDLCPCPFCETLCWLLRLSHQRPERQTRALPGYAELLTREVALAASETGYRGAGHVHFGGGTPTLLPPAAFARFIADVDKHFGLTADAR